MNSMIVTTLSHYAIISKLGQGGMSKEVNIAFCFQIADKPTNIDFVGYWTTSGLPAKLVGPRLFKNKKGSFM